MYTVSVKGEPLRDYPVASSNEDAAEKHANWRLDQSLEDSNIYTVIYSLKGSIIEKTNVKMIMDVTFIGEEIEQ